MKSQVHVSFNVGKARAELARRILDSIGYTSARDRESVPWGMSFAVFDESDPDLTRLRELLRSHNVEWSERKEYLYTDSELRQAPLLWMYMPTAPKDLGVPFSRDQYDFADACPNCGTGARRIKPLIARASAFPKRAKICESAHGDVLIAASAADALRRESVTGIDLLEVHASKGDQVLPWYRLTATHELPRMSPNTRGIIMSEFKRRCPICQQDEFYHSAHDPIEIAYSSGSVDVGQLPDVVHTWERFGKSGIEEPFKFSRFAPPLLLVKPRVFDLFRAEKIKRAAFLPVRLE